MDDNALLDRIEDLLREHGPQWKTIGEILQQHPEKIRARWRRSGREVREASEDENDLNHQSVIFTDKQKSEKIDWREMLAHAVTGQDINKRLSPCQETANIHIHTDKPIAIVYTGDWHLGDNGTDYISWYDDIHLIMDTPNMYMIDLGDDYQNMRSFRVLANVLNQVLTPPQQAAMMKSLVDELTSKNKLLAKIGGNHDMEFDERLFGQALQSYLYENSEAPIFQNRGLLQIRVGDETYTNLVFHKSRYSSVFRGAHGAYREWQMSYPAEVVAGAHNHIPAFEIMWGYNWGAQTGQNFGGEVFLIKVGTYQDSEFGFRYFSNGGFPLNPTVVYFPDTHKKLAFMDIRDAIAFMNRS